MTRSAEPDAPVRLQQWKKVTSFSEQPHDTTPETPTSEACFQPAVCRHRPEPKTSLTELLCGGGKQTPGPNEPMSGENKTNAAEMDVK